MSRVKERENVLCVGEFKSGTCQRREGQRRLSITSIFDSPALDRKTITKDSRYSFHEPVWKIPALAVFETADTQHTQTSREPRPSRTGALSELQ